MYSARLKPIATKWSSGSSIYKDSTRSQPVHELSLYHYLFMHDHARSQ